MKGLRVTLMVLFPPALLVFALWVWGNFQKKASKDYDAIIAEASARYGADPKLIRSVIWRESDFDPDATGLAQERGLMQVTPIAGKEWAQSEGIQNFQETDLFDPRTNVMAGTWYLTRAMSRWKDTDKPEVFGLAEYNAGRTHARRWAASLPEPVAAAFIEQIDYPTTKQYILDILERHHSYQIDPDPPAIEVAWWKVDGYLWRWMERQRIKKIKESQSASE